MSRAAAVGGESDCDRAYTSFEIEDIVNRWYKSRPLAATAIGLVVIVPSAAKALPATTAPTSAASASALTQLAIWSGGLTASQPGGIADQDLRRDLGVLGSDSATLESTLTHLQKVAYDLAIKDAQSYFATGNDHSKDEDLTLASAVLAPSDTCSVLDPTCLLGPPIDTGEVPSADPGPLLPDTPVEPSTGLLAGMAPVAVTPLDGATGDTVSALQNWAVTTYTGAGLGCDQGSLDQPGPLATGTTLTHGACDPSSSSPSGNPQGGIIGGASPAAQCLGATTQVSPASSCGGHYLAPRRVYTCTPRFDPVQFPGVQYTPGQVKGVASMYVNCTYNSRLIVIRPSVWHPGLRNRVRNLSASGITTTDSGAVSRQATATDFVYPQRCIYNDTWYGQMRGYYVANNGRQVALAAMGGYAPIYTVDQDYC